MYMLYMYYINIIYKYFKYINKYIQQINVFYNEAVQRIKSVLDVKRGIIKNVPDMNLSLPDLIIQHISYCL